MMIDQLNKQYESADIETVIAGVVDQFGSGLRVASSLSIEDQVLTHYILKKDPKATIFVLDTGRLPVETHTVMAQTESLYQMRYTVYLPDAMAVEAMVQKKGINLFYDSSDNRHLCCRLRKIEPLKRALAGATAWMTGLRRSQSQSRDQLALFEYDSTHDLVKINPLAYWEEGQVWDTIRQYAIPYNVLYDQGYTSIGCAPCTRAVEPGESIRSGRWWWELADTQKECGLHVVDGQWVRKKKDDK